MEDNIACIICFSECYGTKILTKRFYSIELAIIEFCNLYGLGALTFYKLFWSQQNSLAVIKKMGRERDKNVFLISHKDELIGRVNHLLKVVKENGFTSYENDIDIVE